MFLPHIESIGDGRGFSIVCLGSQGLGSLWAPDIYYKQGWQQRGALKRIGNPPSLEALYSGVFKYAPSPFSYASY